MRRIPATVAAACLLLALAAGSAWSQSPGDEPVPMLPHPEAEVASLRISHGSSADTVYVGQSRSDHWNATNNWWNVWTGKRRPGVNDPANAIWDWDDLSVLAAHGVGDSLAGWWPDLRLYTSTGGYTRPDAQRPWWALDHGNVANYAINQGEGAKRTYGVVGVWHADGGVAQAGGSAVQWSPLSGTRSAWCGLRQLNDVSVVDAVTGNPFNQSTVERISGGGPFGGARRYPGYASQWDQLLYRDFAVPAGQPLAISFLYRTRMSEGAVLASATRTGWFHGDPLAVTPGNFVSSSAAGANAPRDSFMVYVGAPVNDTSCTYSDGSVAPVYDPQRRWFSEVLRLFDGAPYFEVFAVAGSHPADTAGATPFANVSLSAQQVDAIRAVSGGVVRLVFRVKTNRGSSDDDGSGGFDSATRGAALLDEVTVNGALVGDFELPEQGGPGAIDNRPAASALSHWKSTGKPPSVYAHLGNLEAGINYAELCGAWDSPARACDIRGNVLMMGCYDVFEAHMDPRYESMRNGFPGAWSPTINMTVARDGSNAVNPHGLTQAIVSATDGIKLMLDVYAGQLNLPFTGVGYWPACQVWPVAQANNGAKVWSDPLGTPFLVYNPDPQCYSDWFDLGADIGFPPLANAYNAPDSLRVWIGLYQACFRWGVTLGCNDNDGVYFDNVSVAFVDRPGVQANALEPGAIRSYTWELLADAFPANETPTLPNSANFDTTTALIVGPRNIAQATGNQQRFCIQPDSVLVNAPDVSGSAHPTLGHATRLDLVFRILPGPGNYAIASTGGRIFPPTSAMRLLDAATNQFETVAPGDGSFWGEYLANPGAFSAGTHFGGHTWDHLTWNSARCDTAEANVFPVAGLIGTGLTSGLYANTLHEEDPKFATLGITKFRCFVVDTARAAENANIVCDGTVPAWLSSVPYWRSGWDGNTTTKEHTKIIPDGLLTPGAHVQYFYRKSACADSLHAIALMPDTSRVWQPGEGSVDGHRWQQFGVLPDRWKDVAFGGGSMACMLYVDWNDRRGNERVFVSVMDSLGATVYYKWGAHNGWHAPALPGPRTVDYLASYPVHGRNQQPGSAWDMYGVRASESVASGAVSLGSRTANRASMGYAAGRYARTGPTPEMLRRFYRLLTIQTGDLNSSILGPFLDKSQDDVGMLNDFLTGNDPGSTAQPRGLYIGGDGFVQSEDLLNGQNASHGQFLRTKLGLTLRNGSYQAISGNTNDCADLLTTSAFSSNQAIFGVGNACTYSNDLLQRNPAIVEAVEATYYENVGVNGPYVASVYKPPTATRNWATYTEGANLEHLWARWCGPAPWYATCWGRIYIDRLLYNLLVYEGPLGSECMVTPAHPLICLEAPGGGRPPLADFMKVGNSLVRSGTARIQFGVATPDRVRIRLYDVAGRVIRTLADRSFAAGEYDLVWDGAGDDGSRVARGVYFARVEYATRGFSGNGRVVLLK